MQFTKDNNPNKSKAEKTINPYQKLADLQELGNVEAYNDMCDELDLKELRTDYETEESNKAKENDKENKEELKMKKFSDENITVLLHKDLLIKKDIIKIIAKIIVDKKVPIGSNLSCNIREVDKDDGKVKLEFRIQPLNLNKLNLFGQYDDEYIEM